MKYYRIINFLLYYHFIIELLDENSIRANNIYNKMNLDETPTLFLEFHETKKSDNHQTEIAC
jgi:D-lactate dehydrogenase (cytochrome)